MSWSPIECGNFIAITCAQLCNTNYYHLMNNWLCSDFYLSMNRRDLLGSLLLLNFWCGQEQVCHSVSIHAQVETQYMAWSHVKTFKSSFFTLSLWHVPQNMLHMGSLVKDLRFFVISLSHKRLRLMCVCAPIIVIIIKHFHNSVSSLKSLLRMPSVLIVQLLYR